MRHVYRNPGILLAAVAAVTAGPAVGVRPVQETPISYLGGWGDKPLRTKRKVKQAKPRKRSNRSTISARVRRKHRRAQG